MPRHPGLYTSDSKACSFLIACTTTLSLSLIHCNISHPPVMVKPYASSWLPRLLTIWDHPRRRPAPRPPPLRRLLPGESLTTRHLLDRALQQLQLLQDFASANGLELPTNLAHDRKTSRSHSRGSLRQVDCRFLARPISLARLPRDILVDIIQRVIYRPEPQENLLPRYISWGFAPFGHSPCLLEIAYQEFYRVNSMVIEFHNLVAAYNWRSERKLFGHSLATDNVEIIDLHSQLFPGTRLDNRGLEAKIWLFLFRDLVLSFTPKVKLIRLHFTHTVRWNEVTVPQG